MSEFPQECPLSMRPKEPDGSYRVPIEGHLEGRYLKVTPQDASHYWWADGKGSCRINGLIAEVRGFNSRQWRAGGTCCGKCKNTLNVYTPETTP